LCDDQGPQNVKLIIVLPSLAKEGEGEKEREREREAAQDETKTSDLNPKLLTFLVTEFVSKLCSNWSVRETPERPGENCRYNDRMEAADNGNHTKLGELEIKLRRRWPQFRENARNGHLTPPPPISELGGSSSQPFRDRKF
jgi:hypothetical protein